MHKHLSIRANDSSFYIEKAIGFTQEKLDGFMSNLNQMFNIIIKSGFDTKTVFLRMDNYSQANFHLPEHSNFSAIFHDSKNQPVIYYHNNFFMDYNKNLYNFLRQFIEKNNLFLSSLLFYGDSLSYMVNLKNNRFDESLNDIFSYEDENKQIIFSACAFHYVMINCPNSDILYLLKSKRFLTLLNKSKNKVLFINKAFHTQPYLFNILIDKIKLNQIEFVFLFQAIVDKDYYVKLEKTEKFIETQYFQDNIKGLKCKQFIDIVKNASEIEGTIVESITSKLKGVFNFQNF